MTHFFPFQFIDWIEGISGISYIERIINVGDREFVL